MDDKAVIDTAMVDIKVYSVEASNIRRGLARVKKSDYEAGLETII